MKNDNIWNIWNIYIVQSVYIHYHVNQGSIHQQQTQPQQLEQISDQKSYRADLQHCSQPGLELPYEINGVKFGTRIAKVYKLQTKKSSSNLLQANETVDEYSTIFNYFYEI